MELFSEALDTNLFFDARYTCDLDNSSPELHWTEPPVNCVELALLMEASNAQLGRIIHWVVYSIPPSIRHLPPGIPPQDTLPNGIHQGLNSYQKLGYFGPCPPPGDPPHRYCFYLFALEKSLILPHRARGEELLCAMGDSVLEKATLIGNYARIIQKAG